MTSAKTSSCRWRCNQLVVPLSSDESLLVTLTLHHFHLPTYLVANNQSFLSPWLPSSLGNLIPVSAVQTFLFQHQLTNHIINNYVALSSRLKASVSHVFPIVIFSSTHPTSQTLWFKGYSICQDNLKLVSRNFNQESIIEYRLMFRCSLLDWWIFKALTRIDFFTNKH